VERLRDIERTFLGLMLLFGIEIRRILFVLAFNPLRCPGPPGWGFDVLVTNLWLLEAICWIGSVLGVLPFQLEPLWLDCSPEGFVL
jgi:hypothetical protein